LMATGDNQVLNRPALLEEELSESNNQSNSLADESENSNAAEKIQSKSIKQKVLQ
jgi:hypothetical protein